MVVDTSALLAIFWEEQDAELYVKAIESSLRPVMSAATFYECCVVVFGDRRSSEDVADLHRLVEALGIAVIPFDASDAIAAAHAYRKYGNGVHRAGLNLGDCPAYALASLRKEPLLFAGGDFRKTDVISAV